MAVLRCGPRIPQRHRRHQPRVTATTMNVHTSNATRQRRPHRRGMALLMVVSIIAVASLLGFAMLSSSALQAQMSSTLPQVAQADYLADSGIQYAIHQLQQTAASDEVYTGGTHSFDDPSRRRFIVTVTRRPGSTTLFDIVSRGEVLDSSGQVIAARTATATVRAWAELKYDHSAVMGGHATLNSDGYVRIDSLTANGKVTLNASNVVTGVLAAPDYSGPAASAPNFQKITQFTQRVPRAADIRKFDQVPYLWSDGQYYWAQPVPAIWGQLYDCKLKPTPSNPAGVYYHVGALTLLGDVEIDGTLYVRNGNLRISGDGNRIDGTQSHSKGFPALVVEGDVQAASLRTVDRLRVDGVTWVNGSIGSKTLLGAAARFEFNGAVIVPSGGIYMFKIGTLRGEVHIRYDKGNIDVPRLDRNLISKVKILTWDGG